MPPVIISQTAFASDSVKAHDVYGLWLTQSQTAKVEIADCGNDTPCGTITWVDAPEGETPLDDQNPDPDLQDRPMVGVQMVYGFERKDSGWKKGKIYNPEDGKTYKSSMKQKEDGTLQVKGCVGPFCQSQIWTRIEP